jgi:hypothetical protein
MKISQYSLDKTNRELRSSVSKVKRLIFEGYVITGCIPHSSLLLETQLQLLQAMLTESGIYIYKCILIISDDNSMNEKMKWIVELKQQINIEQLINASVERSS